MRLERRDELWRVWWRPLHSHNDLECRVDFLDVTAEDFIARYEKTRIWSPFNFELSFRLCRGDYAEGFGMGEFVQMNAEGAATRSRLTNEERARVLIDRFGVSEEMVRRLPEDRPTPPPPGSATAERAARQSSSP